MTPVQELLESIKAKRAEQAKCLAELDLWAAVQAQGIDIGTVSTFGFKPEWLTRIERAQRDNAMRMRRPDPFTGSRDANGHYECMVYNFVRHKDGTVTRLQPSLQAP
jgi:hypothetical protein